MVTTGTRLLLSVALCLCTTVKSLGLTRLPSIDDHRCEEVVTELRQKVSQLEAIVEELQHESSYCMANPVHFADFVEPAKPSQSVRLASFVDSLLAGEGTLQLGGHVKADFIHDFNAIGSTDVFDPFTIPTDGRPGENTRFHARQTILNLDYRPVEGCNDFQVFVEGDFFGTSDPFQRSRAFWRLRHAYIRVVRLLAGQTWSTFMDESIIPATLDFESPRSVILDRRGLLRWTRPVGDCLAISVAVEDPRPLFDLDSAPAGEIERPAPDLVARTRCERDWGHLQSAAVVRLLRYRQDSGAEDDVIGWGLNFTGRVHLREHDSAVFQVAFGEGIQGYRQAPDAAVDAAGQIETIPVIAWLVGYEVDWNERLASTFVYSVGEGNNTAFQLANAPQAVEYVAANLRYQARTRLSYGVEYLYGTRTDRDDSMGEAHRLQFCVRYDLP